MIKRESYLTWLVKHKENGLIKVVSGVRRSGKSTLFELYKETLILSGVLDEQIIHINFEDLTYYGIRNFLSLNEYILNLTSVSQKYYIFLDEIQMVEKFEEVLNSLNLKENFDIYVTGSNAFFMSGELATLLTGRYVELKIMPLSFKEFYSVHTDKTLTDAYNLYCKTSFPYLAKKDDVEEFIYYIRSTYNDIALKDIVSRYRITEIGMLERVFSFLLSAIGSEISINKIANTMKSQGISISNNTIEKYVDAFVGGLILYCAPRYDIHGRKILQRIEKYYVVDLGFKKLLLPNSTGDGGRDLENIIFLELKRRYREVYVGKCKNFEVDFVCIDDEAKPTYFQVAYTTMAEDTLKRELRSLEQIKDNNPKYLLTLDEINKTANYNGIIKLNALDWLIH